MGEFDWLEDAAVKIRDKEYEVAKRNREKIPFTAVNSSFDDCSGAEKIGTRSNGFYGGIQWQLYNATREPLFLENAMKIEKKLDAVLMDSQAMDDGSGILWMPTAVANFHMTGSRPARNRALLAANNLAGRFNPNGNFIRAFNDPDAGENIRPKESSAGIAHIRTLMSLPLLYWASEVTKDPRFRAIGVKHASMAAQNFIREDGSVREMVRFDPKTGAVLDTGEETKENIANNPKGSEEAQDHAALRKQAMALYGFTLSFFHTGESDFLKAAEKTAAFFLSNTPRKDACLTDDAGNDAPGDDNSCAEDACPEDDAAVAMASSGLILLAGLVGNDQSLLPPVAAALSAGYRDTALRLLKFLTEKRVCFDAGRDELLEHCLPEGQDKVKESDKLEEPNKEEKQSNVGEQDKEEDQNNVGEQDKEEDQNNVGEQSKPEDTDKQKTIPLIYADYFYIEAVWRLTGRELLIW